MELFEDIIKVEKVKARNMANVPCVGNGLEGLDIRNEFATEALHEAYRIGQASNAFNGDFIRMYCGI